MKILSAALLAFDLSIINKKKKNFANQQNEQKRNLINLSLTVLYFFAIKAEKIAKIYICN